MLNQKSGRHFTNAPTMTRGGFLKGILAFGIAQSITLATIANAPSANASVGGMMRNVGARMGVMFGQKEDNSWAREVMDKTYPTTDVIEEHHNAKYTEEITKTYGGN